MSITKQNTKGFTLVEMLIIAPVVILVISGFIALIITMVGDVLAMRDRNNMTFEIRDTLDRIEQDSRLSTQFLVTSGTLPSPQGSDSGFAGTAAFTSTDSLIMGTLTTNKNPMDSTRQLVFYAKQPNDCGSLETYNRPFIGKTIYFLKNGSLWRRTFLFNYNTNATPNDETLCAAPWQQNSCNPGYLPATRCQTNDIEVMKNVSSFGVKYYSTPSSTTDIGPTNALSATTIEVTLNGQKTIVGRTITNSGSLRASRLNSIDADLPLPATPTVSVQDNNANAAVFSWPTVPSATSYLISYNINGGSWVNATNDSTTLSYAVNANRQDTVTLRVAARNSTGTSAYATAALTIPDWNTCTPQGGWVAFGGTYSTPGFTKTNAEIVKLKGVYKNGSIAQGTVLCVLPDGFRPAVPMVFQVGTSPASATRIDISTSGSVTLGDTSTNATWVSLDNIHFISNTALYSTVAITPSNGWTNVGGASPTLAVRKDSLNRVHVQGVIKSGTTTDTTAVGALPVGYRPSEYHDFTVRSNLPLNQMGVNAASLQYRSNTAGVNAFYATQAMFYISGAGTWTTLLPLQNNWVAYGSPGVFTAPQYTKASDNLVTIRGHISNGITTSGTKIATLPAGYRPKQRLMMYVGSYNSHGRIDIDTNGDILIITASSALTSLDNISFIAEQ
jgi:hypothetical protein